MECPHGGGDRFIEAHFSVSLQVSDAPSLARLQNQSWVTMALFNLLIQWDRLSPDVDGFVPLSMAPFSL